MLQANESRLPVLRKWASGSARKGVGMKCRDAACRVYGGGKQHPVMWHALLARLTPVTCFVCPTYSCNTLCLPNLLLWHTLFAQLAPITRHAASLHLCEALLQRCRCNHSRESEHCFQSAKALLSSCKSIAFRLQKHYSQRIKSMR